MHYELCINLNHRQALAINLSIKVEGKHISHARQIVKHCHDAHISVKAIHLILRGHAVKQQTAVGVLRVHHRMDEEPHKGVDDFITCQFRVHHITAAVDAAMRHLHTGFVGIVYQWTGMVDERLLESAIEDGFFIFHKHTHALFLQFTDGARAEIHHLLIQVGGARCTFDDMFPSFRRNKAQHKVARRILSL